MGEYYERIGLPDEPTDCPCGEEFQTREHILFDCPRYDDYRHYLEVEGSVPELSQVLGTKKGIECLIEFLKSSRAFTKTGEPPQDS